MLTALLLAAGCVATAACDDESEPLPKEVTVELDDPAVDLLYRDESDRLRPVETLDAIPPPRRGAVLVYHSEAIRVDSEDDDVYVANLLEAEADESVTARRFDRQTHLRRLRQLDRALAAGEEAVDTAREVAKLSEGSRRRDASEKARRKFEQLLPKIPESDDDGDESRPAESPDPE